MSQPDKESFQGFPPDLTNLIIEVEENSGARYLVNYNDEKDNFSTVPEFCDIAFMNNPAGKTGPETYGMGVGTYSASGGQLQLIYKGQPVSNNTPLKIPMVVAANELNATWKEPLTWRIDTRPEWTGVTFNVTFAPDWKGLGANSVAGKPNAMKKVEIPSNATFPMVGYSSLQDSGMITAFIGPAKDGVERKITDNVGNDAAKISTYIPVKQVGVEGVKLASADWPKYTDDDINVFYTNAEIDANKLFDAFRKSNAKFEITYSDNSSRTISTDEYIANNVWFYNLSLGYQGVSQQGILPKLIQVDDSFTWPRGSMLDTGIGRSSLTQGQTSVLWYGRQENVDTLEDLYGDLSESWTVRINYMPWMYNNSVDATNVTVPIPLYIYEEATVESLFPSLGPLDVVGFDTPRAMLDNELEALQRRWVLKAKYVKGRDEVIKDIPLTKEMFYAGYFGASAALVATNSGWWGLTGQQSWDGTSSIAIPGTAPVTVWHPNTSRLGYNSIEGGMQTNGIRYDYYLPLWFRGTPLTEDEGITVNVIKK